MYKKKQYSMTLADVLPMDFNTVETGEKGVWGYCRPEMDIVNKLIK